MELVTEIDFLNLPDLEVEDDDRVILVHFEDWPVVQVWREAA